MDLNLEASIVDTTELTATINQGVSVVATIEQPQLDVVVVSGPPGPAGPPGSGSITNLTGQYPIFYDAGSGVVGIVSGYYATFSQLTGASGALVAQIQTAAAGVNSLNGVSGFVALAAQNPLFVSVAGQTITISGSGLATSGDLNRYYLSTNPQGYATSGDLTTTGSYLYNLITGNTGVAGLSTGVISLNGATGAIQLTGAGNVTVSRAGQLITISGANSGEVSQAQLDSLSGYVNSQDAATGRAAVLYASGASGALQTQINALPTAAQLAQTGSDLYRLITGESGQGVIDYATKIQLTQSGIDLMGYANGVGANLSGQLTLTGQTLDNKINSLSGFTTGVSGYLQNQIALFSAGVVSVNGLSGQLNLVGAAGIMVSPSGQTIYISGEQWVHLTGNELITGVKTFVDMVSGLSGFAVARDGAYYQDGKLALRVATRIQSPLDKHIMIGSDCPLMSGIANTLIGAPAGILAPLTPLLNYTIAIGNKDTLSDIRTGLENTVIGDSTFIRLQNGQQNTVIGGSIAPQVVISYANIALGNYSLNVLKSGDYNIAIGRRAGGSNYSNGTGIVPSGLVTGSRNILIGHDVNITGALAGYADNSLNIGNSIFGSDIYQYTGSRIGICHNNPQFNLHVSGEVGLASVSTSTTANAGAATLPANPVGFVIINITGSNFKIPYYNI